VRHRRPRHARRASHDLVSFTRLLLETIGARHVGIDWHGHNDRGLGVTNNIIALEAGADRIHGTALGIGERVGNASLDLTLMNLKLLGELGDRDLSALVPWCEAVAGPARCRSTASTRSSARTRFGRRPASTPPP
jgi:isopropylmalate/homocitrate/citramalate synthase